MADALTQEIVEVVLTWPEVDAVVEGGSRSTGNADAASDIDLYVYARPEPDVERRREFILARSDRFEIDNRVWETGDEWTDRDSGTVVDLMYRSPEWIEGELARVLDQHQASLGYSTCLWHNVRTSRLLFDRYGWFEALQAKARQPYPVELARAIVAKNYRLLRNAESSFMSQILKAAARGDLVSVNHRAAAFLASYFDISFALNLTPHPGEKRLVMHASGLPLAPAGLGDQVRALVAAGAECNRDRLEGILDGMVDELDQLLAGAGFGS
jgi:hypothetical protein